MFYQVIEKTQVSFADGLCASDPRPDDWHSTERPEIERAKKVCRQCPIIDLCYQYAQENRERFGVWGGMDHNERGFFHKTRF